MSSRNVLVLALDPVPEEDIRAAIAERRDGGDVDVLVVAPASNLSSLQWLAGEEDEARAEASELAERAADAVPAHAEAAVGDSDPALAVQDALSEFPADEIVVAGQPDTELDARLRELGPPVSLLEGSGRETGTAEDLTREVARGRSAGTPFALLGIVGAVVIGVFAVVTAIALLVYFLV